MIVIEDLRLNTRIKKLLYKSWMIVGDLLL